MRSVCLALLLLLPGMTTLHEAGAQQPMPPKPVKIKRYFLKANTTSLMLGSVPFRNVGANLPDLFEQFLHGNDATATQMLADAKKAGIRFARCFGGTWGPDDFGLFETDPTRWFAAFDKMLDAADNAGIALVPSLLFNINMLPEYVRKKTGKDEQVVNYLTPGSASNELALTYVTAVVSHYKNDTRVLFWEIGNEYNLEADLSAQWKKRPANQIPNSDQIRAFLIQIAERIKSLDKQHLVTSGNADMRPYSWHIRQAMLSHKSASDPNDYPMDWTKDTFYEYAEMLAFFNPPPLDIVSVHQYAPEADTDTPNWLMFDSDKAFMLLWTRTASDLMHKPLFVGEFGQKIFVDGKEQEALWDKDYLRRIGLSDAPIAAIWAWEFAPDHPDQAPLSLSPTRTPKLIATITATNAGLLQAVAQSLHAPPRKKLPIR